MSSSDKFNLTFNGEIRPGLNVTKVKVAFAQALTIEDAKRVEAFFTGRVVTLRRNLDKETAEAFYTKMYRAGAILTLVPADSAESALAENSGMNVEFHTESAGQVDQSWPVPSTKKSTNSKPAAKKKTAGKKRVAHKKTTTVAAKVRKKKPSKTALAKDAEEAAIRDAVAEAASKLEQEAKEKADQKARQRQIKKEAAEGAAAEQYAKQQAIEAAAKAEAEKEAAAKKAAELAAKLKAEKAAATAKAKAKKEAAQKKAAEQAALKQAMAAAVREKNRREAAKKKAEEEAAKAKAADLEKQRAIEAEAQRKREEYAERKRIAAVNAAREKAASKVQFAEQELQDAMAKVALLEDKAELARIELERLSQSEPAVLPTATNSGKALKKSAEISRQSNKTGAAPGSIAFGLKRQGAPNFFNLRAFQNTSVPDQRADKSGQISKALLIIFAVTLAVLFALLIRMTLKPLPETHAQLPKSLIVDNTGQLTHVAASHLFTLDRAGVSIQHSTLSAMGLPDNSQVLSGKDGKLLTAQSPQAVEAGNSSDWIVIECDLEASLCEPHSAELPAENISSWVIDKRTQDQFIAMPAINTLLKLSPTGKILAQAGPDLPTGATLQLSNGLLYITSAQGPAISIYRPDNVDFGQQLDEIIVQPAIAAGQTEVDDFVWSADIWWVILRNPDNGQVGLYRFDQQWNFLDQIPIDSHRRPQKLIAWGDKVLLLFRDELALQRIGPDGLLQAPLILEQLEEIVQEHQSAQHWLEKLWKLLLLFLALLAGFSLCSSQWFRIRKLVDSTSQYRNAPSIDTLHDSISWIAPAPNRTRRFRLLSILYGAACGVFLAATFFLQLPMAVSVPAGIALTGPAFLLAVLWNSPAGHLGFMTDGLIIVDHTNTYHLGSGSRIHYRGNFLLIDDVLVYQGSAFFPVFEQPAIQHHVLPYAIAGVKIDRKTLWIKALQSGHPFAIGIVTCMAAVSAATLCAVVLS